MPSQLPLDWEFLLQNLDMANIFGQLGLGQKTSYLKRDRNGFGQQDSGRPVYFLNEKKKKKRVFDYFPLEKS